MKELYLVWGPPFSGQRRWIAQSIAESEKPQGCAVFFADLGDETNYSPERLKAKIDKACLGESHLRQIFFEIPWQAALDEFDYLAPREWTVHFVAICPFDAERLPEHYLRGLEEYARFSGSSVLVLSPVDNEELPAWFGTEILNFGPRLEVFEEPIWTESLVPKRDHFFTHVEAFDVQQWPCIPDRELGLRLFRRLSEGHCGALWGADLMYRSKATRVEFLSLTQGQVFDWSSSHQDFVNQCEEDTGLLQIAGYPLLPKEFLRELSQLGI